MDSESASHPWFALQVRARHERSVAEFLSGKGYEWFLPTYRCRRRWSDRIKEVTLPLFPGYLFCRFNSLDRLPILTTPGVIQVVGMARSPVPIAEAEIAALQAAVKSGLPAQPWPFLRVGQRVRLDYGSLYGLEGILLDFKGNYRLILSVTLLQRSVALEVDAAWVTPVSDWRRLRHVSPLAQPAEAPVAA